MKNFYYLASPECKLFETGDGKPTCALTKNYVLEVIRQQANGDPPYSLRVPKDILYEAHTWNIPESLLKITPLEGKGDNNTDPYDAAELIMGGTLCVINACRVRPCVISEVGPFGSKLK